MFSVGIVGLPNAGKSTLFKALTKIAVPISIYPFTTIDPNRGVVQVEDKRLERIKELIKPKKTTPVLIEFVDIAGLVKDAHLGKGLGNKFLSHINEVDLILEVVRLFINEKSFTWRIPQTFRETSTLSKKKFCLGTKKFFCLPLRRQKKN
ncbi:MAG: GTPase [Patescibacteria group bacterium]